MATIPRTPTVVEQIVETEEERAFWEVVRHHERPPFYDAKEGVGNRLNRAARIVYEERLTPNSDGSYTVEGSPGHTYRVREHCSCPDSTYRKERGPCYHEIAVVLYVEWQRRLRGSAPVALGTLRAGTLPLPPVTVDERLAQDPAADLPMIAPREEGPIYTTTAGARYTLPEGEMMADESIPEPDDQDAPTAILERPTPEPARVTAAVSAGQTLVSRTPQETDLEAALQTWTQERAVVQRFLKQELKANVDYYTLRIGGKDSKPSLSKAGAEKVMGWLKIQASFTPDTGTWEMLGRPQDLVCYVCTLRTRSGEIVGEGRGARSLKKDGGDVNKAIKMAEKSACVSAVLRTGALSDVFTCDLEDMQEEPAKGATPAKPNPLHPAAELRQRIWAQVQKMDTTVRTREQVEAFIKARTGMDLHPDLYQAIENRLREVGR